jgi:uncharacterized protein YbjT (DUF2867 family)
MKTASCAVVGASGHIGQGIVKILLGRQRTVRVIGRSAGRLQSAIDSGAEAYVGTLEDAEFLARVFAKVGVVFAMIPPNPQAEDFRAFQNRVGEAMVTALVKAGVRHVVNLSSQGANLPEGTGPIAGLYDQEQRLNGIPGLNVVHLRPAFFMENLMMNMEMIRTQNINGMPLRGDLPVPVIATRDIALVASDYLLGLHFSGKSVRDLLGQRDLSMTEMTRILGQAIEKPDLKYVQFPYEAAEQAMVAAGLSRDMARLYIEMHHALNEGRLMRGVCRTPENTTATSFEVFARDFAAMYRRAY